MFDIGFTELLLIAVVALVVLGPEKLPMAVRTLGLWIGKAKRTISGIQTEISEELRLDELKRTVSDTQEQLSSELDELKSPFMDESKTIDSMTSGAVVADSEITYAVADHSAVSDLSSNDLASSDPSLSDSTPNEAMVSDDTVTATENPQLADTDKKIINE